MQLHGDPTALAPERLLVFELRGSIQSFAAAIQRIPGLEFVDEEELVGDELDKAPVAYLLIPDGRALEQILSLWHRWNERQPLGRGFTPWGDVFELLRDLRPWGPSDRVRDEERDILAAEIEDRADGDLVKLEIELVFRANGDRAEGAEADVRAAVAAQGGRIIDRSRIPDIAYHALLAELLVRSVRRIVERAGDSVAGLESVMHIRPQSVAPSIDVADRSGIQPPAQLQAPALSPILALVDGVPIAAHPILDGWLNVDDRFGLERDALVAQRVHATAMASLIVHGDRNRPEPPLPRRIHVVPVMKWGVDSEILPDNRLVVDLIYVAVSGMRDGADPTAPDVLIINLSLGNARRPFHGQVSPWARLLDRLAWRFGILFLVSAGNATEPFLIPGFGGLNDFEQAEATARAKGTLAAIAGLMAERRIISPAESVNGITVGGSNEDSVPIAHRAVAGVNVDPYPTHQMSNPSSRLGPGFADSVKPDILMPGAREHVRVLGNVGGLRVRPSQPSRAFGLKVAAPPVDGNPASEGYTNGTSAAAALASRTCHRIHDALEAVYGNEFVDLPHIRRAVVLKALLVHGARWSANSVQLIRETVGPAGGRKHVQQKNNIRRFLGYGTLDPDDAVACAADRATFWAIGALPPERSVLLQIPIPACIGGVAQPHALIATVAWFTPVQAGRRSYRSVRLRLLEPTEYLEPLRISGAPDQPDATQVRRGTVISRRWSGDRAPVVAAGTSAELVVQREPDQGMAIDDEVPFGIAITLTMPGVIEIYDEVRLRLGVPVRAPAGRARA